MLANLRSSMAYKTSFDKYSYSMLNLNYYNVTIQIGKFVWINILGDNRDIKKNVVKLNFAHHTDPHLVVEILHLAIKEARKGIHIDHTHEDTDEKSFYGLV